MIRFLANLFRKPTLDEIRTKEEKLAESIYQKSRREAFSWARNPIGFDFSIYVGVLNNRVQHAVEDKIVDSICRKYNCDYSFRANGFLKFGTSYNTEKLINADRD